jgi:uncharacterized membrane protein YgcG
MAVKPVVVFIAAALTASAPSQAEDFLNPQFSSPGTMLFISIPLGGSTAKENVPSYGFALQGRRQYERVMVDNRMFNAFEGMLAGIEAKWLLAGGLVAAAGIYAISTSGGGGGSGGSNSGSGGSGGGSSSGQSSNPPPPPCQQTDPCKK